MAKNATISLTFKLTDDANGLQRLTMSAANLREVMKETVEVSTELQSKFINFAALSTSVRSMSDSINQVVGTLNNLTGESAQFNKAMREANTMAGKDSAGFKQLKGEVADLAKEIPIARDQLANGLYQTISNGVPEDNWIEFLNKSARSAVGGLANINKVVGVTSTVIKNYGLEWSAAGDIQDKIQLTAKNGKTSFDELSQSLPRVTGNAATLDVSIDELMGSFATLTGVSGNTAEVSTQLAAIFTALVKPSSEAAEMAAKMGIQFDAAAIQAAGGFQNFLSQLNQSVKSYAQTNGVLEQEVYGRLFGSAEAIRALIPLQGELSDKFAANIANMVNSAGTMDAAYDEMSSTGEATAQKLMNWLAALTDSFSGIISIAKPFLTIFSELGSSIVSVMVLVEGLKKFNLQTKILAKSTKLANVAMAALGLRGKSTAAAVRVLSGALKTGAFSATAFKIALRGLLVATGVGAAIAAVIAVISHFVSATDDATESVEKLDDATDDYTQAAAAATVQIDKDIKELGELIKAKKESKETIDRLNDTYGKLFGTYTKLEDWYKILTDKSRLYAKQVGFEAQTRSLSAKIAEAAIKKELAAERMKALETSGKHKTKQSHSVGGSNVYSQRVTVEVETEEYKQAKKDMAAAEAAEAAYQSRLDVISNLAKKNSEDISRGLSKANNEIKVNEMSWQQCTDAIDANDKALKNTTDPKRIKALKAQNAQLKARKKALEGITGLGSKKNEKKKKLVANPTTKEDIDNNIEILSKKLTGKDTPAQQKLIKDIALLKKKRDAIELAEKAASRPTEIKSLEDVDKELDYQRTLRQTVADEKAAEVDAEIKRLEELRATKERAGHTHVPPEELKTYAELNDEESYYNWLLETGTEKERIFAQQQLNDLAKVRKAWDGVLADLKKPGDISTLDTIEKLGEAISYIDEKINTASADEISALQRAKMAYEAKLKAYQRGIEIPTMLHEAEEINKLSGREYKVKIRGMGFDELTAKIGELNHLLNDTENPLTDSQRKDVENLIGIYEKWRKESIDTFDTLRSGWDGVKGIGSGIDGLTNALKDDANAWQTVTGIVEGFLQVFDGIKAIVDLINMFTLATENHARSELADAVAVQGKTAATVAETTATVAATAATEAETAVATTNIAAKSGEAIADATASGAKVPFPGNLIAISTGVAAVLSALAGIGTFATGGIVGGSSKSGDRLLARVNSGEMILNAAQQRNLFRMINTPAAVRLPQYNAHEINADMGFIQTITKEPVIIGGTLRAHGREIICVLANETRIASKSGKKTNIVI